MAAILPHLAEPNEMSDVERAYDSCASSLSGPDLGEGHPACPSPDAVVADAHAGLLTMTFVRDAVFTSLQGKQFIVKPGNKEGKDLKTVYIVLDQPIGPGPAWNPATNPDVNQYALLSWTSKMNAPSWSIPAGAPQIGGACPGAVAGQSIVPPQALVAARRHVNIGLGLPEETPPRLAAAICEHCYATGGQYSTGQVQFAQELRFLWARQAIHTPAMGPNGVASTAFVETMVYAIDNADFKLRGGTDLPPEPTGKRFFRIHDSGDFFEAEYLRQWKMIADRLPDITFWAPSRIWATSWGTEAVNEINAGPSNLIIRPSAYEVNEPGPRDLGPGWAGPTTVIDVKQNLGMSPDREQYVAQREQKNEARGGTDPRYTWDCRAYATDDAKHTCRKAVAPPGLGDSVTGKGCRACWIAPTEIVNYSLH